MRLWDFVEPCVHSSWILTSLTYIHTLIIKFIGDIHHWVHAGVNNTGVVSLWGRVHSILTPKVIVKIVYCIFCTGEYDNIIILF